MGTTSHLAPGDFSRSFNDFLKRVVVDGQGGRATERWAELNMPTARGRTYWGKLLAGTQAMTTEDISVISDWLGVSPFDFVRAVKDDDLSAVVSGSGNAVIINISREAEKKQRTLKTAARKIDKK